MKKYAFPLAIGVAVVAIAVFLAQIGDRKDEDSDKDPPGATAVVPAPAQEASGPKTGDATPPPAPARPKPTQAQPPPGAADSGTPKEPEAETGKTPSIEVVRVSPAGDSVVAGRAEPGSEVVVSDKGKAVGRTKADKRGDWVVIPDPLPPGDHELTAKSRTDPDNPATEAQSRNKVIVVIPEAGKDVAGRETPGKTGALALSVPREGGGGSVVLQKPGLPVTPPGPGKTSPGASPTPDKDRGGSQAKRETIARSDEARSAKPARSGDTGAPAPATRPSGNEMAVSEARPSPAGKSAARPAGESEEASPVQEPGGVAEDTGAPAPATRPSGGEMAVSDARPSPAGKSAARPAEEPGKASPVQEPGGVAEDTGRTEGTGEATATALRVARPEPRAAPRPEKRTVASSRYAKRGRAGGPRPTAGRVAGRKGIPPAGGARDGHRAFEPVGEKGGRVFRTLPRYGGL